MDSEATLCLHCGRSTAGSSVASFCCNGCQAVFRILASGPFKEYYKIRANGLCFEKASPVVDRIDDFSFWNEHRGISIRIYVEGIHCTACVWLLERLAWALPDDVKMTTLDLSRSILTVELTDAAVCSRIGAAVASFGYHPHLIQDEEEGLGLLRQENRKRLLDVGVAGALAGNVMLMSIPLYSGASSGFRSLFEWLSFVLAIPAIFYSGRSFFKNVIVGIQNRLFPIDAPILLAILIAFFYSAHSLALGTHDLYFDSLTALIFLLLGSRYYLSRVRQATGLNPAVLSYFQGQFQGKVGDLIGLKSGDSILFDGKVVSGRAWINPSQFTGESIPVEVKAGDSIFAGCGVTEAEPGFEVRVDGIGRDTRFEKRLNQIQEAKRNRSPFEQVTDRWARGLLKAVVLVAVLALYYFYSHGMLHEGVRRVLALLIVTCPCALALATPLVYSLASDVLMRSGVILKNSESLDEALKIKDIYFDKTGTLTFGALTLVGDPVSGLGIETWGLIRALTERSSHPVSRALFHRVRECEGQSLNDSPRISLDSWGEIPGMGVEGVMKGVRFGILKSKKAENMSSVFFSESHGVQTEICTFTFLDQMRPEVPAVLNQLKKSGYQLHLLTGDRIEGARKSLPSDLPIEITCDLSPEQKARMARNGMMVGDGINDALALVESKVGIAVQGGIEAAIQSAKVYSVRPGINGVVEFLSVATKVRQVLKSNFILSTSYNFVAGLLAILGFMNPLLAAVLMPLSATTVFINSSIRMRRNRK